MGLALVALVACVLVVVVMVVVVVLVVHRSKSGGGPNGGVLPRSSGGSNGGSHTGALITSLPVTDLSKPKCGAWNGHVDWKKSKVTTFQGDTVLLVHHDKQSGTTTPAGVNAVGGITIFAAPSGLPLSDGGYVFGFDVYFPKGYQFARGGKMGGMYMGSGNASGGHHSANASSNRIMWQVDGGVILYIYPPLGAKQPRKELQGDPTYGFGALKAEFAKSLKTGWNRIEIGTKMNTLTNGKANADGIGSLTVNGISHDLPNVVWRTGPWTMGTLVFNEFFGGPDNSPVDQDCMYKNFGVFKWKD